MSSETLIQNFKGAVLVFFFTCAIKLKRNPFLLDLHLNLYILKEHHVCGDQKRSEEEEIRREQKNKSRIIFKYKHYESLKYKYC